MKFSFPPFEFDTETQLLAKNGKFIPLNDKPTALLTLFLNEPNAIHSKTTILEKVWKGKVVSEQVVFQNISYLRALLGDDAIETFARKGYRWRLPLTLSMQSQIVKPLESNVIASSQNPQEINNPNTTPNVLHQSSSKDSAQVTDNLKHSKWLMPVLMTFIVIGLTFSTLFWKNSDLNATSNHSDSIFILTDESGESIGSMLHQVISNSEELVFETTSSVNDTQPLFNAPFVTWESLSHSPNTLLIGLKEYPSSKGVLLRFHIQGKARGWQGFIENSNSQENIAQLKALISLLKTTSYFTIKSDYTAFTQLNLLQSAHPDNQEIEYQVALLHFQLGYLDKASALIDARLNENNSPLQQGIWQLLKVKTAMRNVNWHEATQTIRLAIQNFEDDPINHFMSLAYIEAAWVTNYQQQYSESLNYLNSAIRLARMSNEPDTEFKAHIVLAFLASKRKEFELMAAQLNFASQLILLHKLDSVHEVAIHDVWLWAAKTEAEMLKSSKSIIDSTFSPIYKNEFYYAATKIRDINIKNKKWHAALESIQPWQRRSFVLLTQSHILFGQSELLRGFDTAKDAFRQARIDNIVVDALNAALLILEQQADAEPKMSGKEQLDYIKQNATHVWLKQNKHKLKKLPQLRGVNIF